MKHRFCKAVFQTIERYCGSEGSKNSSRKNKSAFFYHKRTNLPNKASAPPSFCVIRGNDGEENK
jgi:hypothetical protein